MISRISRILMSRAMALLTLLALSLLAGGIAVEFSPGLAAIVIGALLLADLELTPLLRKRQ